MPARVHRLSEGAAMTSVMKTQKIAGHRITLMEGMRYWAKRPAHEHGRTDYPVTIQPMGTPEVVPVVISHLSYDAANRLVNAFNNGEMSFDGRVW
jgi:hypothetical protein